MISDQNKINDLHQELQSAFIKLKALGLSSAFLPLASDVEYLASYAIFKKFGTHPPSGIPNWPIQVRNIAIDIETREGSHAFKTENYLYCDYKKFISKEYLESFYLIHLDASTNHSIDLLIFKKNALEFLVKFVGLTLNNVSCKDVLFPEDHLKQLIAFDYELEIKANLILQTSGLIPTPEEILEDFKRFLKL